jgi:hypothetical protein
MKCLFARHRKRSHGVPKGAIGLAWANPRESPVKYLSGEFSLMRQIAVLVSVLHYIEFQRGLCKYNFYLPEEKGINC